MIGGILTAKLIDFTAARHQLGRIGQSLFDGADAFEKLVEFPVDSVNLID